LLIVGIGIACPKLRAPQFVFQMQAMNHHLHTLLSRLIGAVAMTVILASPASVVAIEAILTDDVSVSTAPKARPTKGDSQVLTIGETDIVFLKFDLESVLPANTAPERVEKATLKVWIQRIQRDGAGQCLVGLVTSAWGERTPYPFAFPNLGQPPSFEGPFSVAQHTAGKSFMVVDVTEHVRKWLSGTPNHGLALRGIRTVGGFVRPSPTTPGPRPFDTPLKATLDSKENTGTGHEPTLQIVLKNAE
jgi:hypothetical protein